MPSMPLVNRRCGSSSSDRSSLACSALPQCPSIDAYSPYRDGGVFGSRSQRAIVSGGSFAATAR
jgi:hypothetical protein